MHNHSQTKLSVQMHLVQRQADASRPDGEEGGTFKTVEIGVRAEREGPLQR